MMLPTYYICPECKALKRLAKQGKCRKCYAWMQPYTREAINQSKHRYEVKP